jgi:hypothetical protein
MAYTKYSLTPADNNAAPPNGAPEGMLPSGVNDTMRDMMSQIRDVGDGIRGGTYTMTAPVITGGSINDTIIGATTATTATFTTATVNRVADSQGGVLAPISSVMRNRIINGAMVIDQRNGGSSVTASVVNAQTYTIDRWAYQASQASKFNIQQNAGSVTPPAGFTNYLGITSTAATSVGAADYFLIDQFIEGFNTADLGWGTANAATVTLSFWVRSSLTGTFGGVFVNAAANRSYPFTYTISAANTWEQKSITVAGDTTGTWLTNNNSGIRLFWNLGLGSNFTATAGSWTGTSNVFGPTGATSVVGTNGATFYITGVQLEKGTQATSFEYRQYQQELSLCQRYFYKTNSATNGSFSVYSGYSVAGGTFGHTYFHKVEMRATPTVSVIGNFTISNCSQPSFIPTSTDNMLVYSTATAAAFAYFAGGAAVLVTAEL